MKTGKGPVTIEAMVDSGVNQNFMSMALIAKCGIQMQALSIPQRMKVADGRTLKEGVIREKTMPLTCETALGIRETEFLPLDGSHFDAVLGMPWLEVWNPDIEWTTGRISP